MDIRARYIPPICPDARWVNSVGVAEGEEEEEEEMAGWDERGREKARRDDSTWRPLGYVLRHTAKYMPRPFPPSPISYPFSFFISSRVPQRGELGAPSSLPKTSAYALSRALTFASMRALLLLLCPHVRVTWYRAPQKPRMQRASRNHATQCRANNNVSSIVIDHTITPTIEIDLTDQIYVVFENAFSASSRTPSCTPTILIIF